MDSRAQRTSLKGNNMDDIELEELEKQFYTYKLDFDLLKLKLDDIKKELIKAYIAEPDRVFDKVKIYEKKGATKVDWKTIAESFKPDRWMIQDHTTVGKPIVVVTIKKPTSQEA